MHVRDLQHISDPHSLSANAEDTHERASGHGAVALETTDFNAWGRLQEWFTNLPEQAALAEDDVKLAESCNSTEDG